LERGQQERTGPGGKPERRRVDVPIDYLGFEIPDVWVVGYGLDYADLFRTLPYIAALKREAYESR
jgi:hypoxanthine-guanine phosphoribosyltransferase